MRGLSVMLACALLAGCGEALIVKTTPPGAMVLIDGQNVGVSPVVKSVTRGQLNNPPTFRVQLEGYKAVEGKFRTRVGPGRIVAAVFTAGLNLIFRSPRYFVPENITMEAINMPRIEALSTGDVEQRLRKLREIYERGLLTDKEYERYRDEIIRGL